MKKVLALFIIVAMTAFSFTTVAFASEEQINTFKESITISNVKVQQLLNQYFEERQNSLLESKTTKDLNKMQKIIDENNSDLLTKENFHTKKSMEEVFGFNIVNADVEPTVTEYKENADGTSTVEIYEWTWVYYKDKDSALVDKMGYGVEHKVMVEQTTQGDYKIVDNQYDDSFFFCPEVPENEIDIMCGENKISNESINAISSSTLNINKLVEYADKYVVHQYSSDPGVSNTSYYNSAYYPSPGSDCANFVSQCLHAGRMSFDKGSNNEYDYGESDDWWYNSGKGSQLETASSESWRVVGKLVEYLKQEGFQYEEITKAGTNSYPNVFPGNPIVTKNKQHIAICVGYNSSGRPIINGHTRDVYHMPLTKGTLSTAYTHTVKIFTSNALGATPQNCTTITPTTSSTMTSKTIPAKESAYFKVNATANDDYKFSFAPYQSNITCTGILYKESTTSNGQVIYLVEKQWAQSKNGNMGIITANLTSGTYFLRFYTESSSAQALTLYHQRI